MENVHREILNEEAAARAEAEKILRNESEKKLEKLKERLELETHKLEDCQREIENYRVHFEEASIRVQKSESLVCF